MIESSAMYRKSNPFGSRRGVALVWVLISVVILTVLGVASHQMSRDNRVLGENFESGQRALYLGDRALSEYFATFVVNTDLTPGPIESSVLDSLDDKNAEDEDGAVTETNADFQGADLKPRDFTYLSATVTITPTKALESALGDVYLVEALAKVQDTRGGRPAAERRVRTFAELVPPLNVLGALTAVGGLTADKKADHFHVDANRKGHCGSGTDIPALVTPSGNAKLEAKKRHLKPKDDEGWDSTTSTAAELKDSLGIDWVRLTSDATFSSLVNVVKIPAQYATLEAIPFNSYRYNAPWPIVRVTGDIISTGHVQGFGVLIVTGNLTIQQQFHWRGLILTGKGIHMSTDKSHLHEHGAIVTGLDCTTAQYAAGACLTTMDEDSKHLGVSYQLCDVEAAWSQLLSLQPLTPSRHTRYF